MRKRARRVVSENVRVLAAVDALRSGDAARFGGCIVALVAPDDAASWWMRVAAENPSAWAVQL